MNTGPAYRIETERLYLTALEPRDAVEFSAAIERSLSELRRWLEWARDEPTPLDDRVQQLRLYRADFDRGEKLAYSIRVRGENTFVGAVMLLRGDRVRWRELGYWISTALAGRGYATEACAALVRSAFDVERLARVEIHCDPGNEKSRAVARRLGFQVDARLRARVERRDGSFSDDEHWSLMASEFESSPAFRLAANVSAFDAIERPLFAPLDTTPRARSAFR